MKLKTQWALLAAFSMVPYLFLGIAGALWLYHSGWWLWWFIVTALVTLAGWPVMRRLQKSGSRPSAGAVPASNEWSPLARSAWDDVQTIADRYQSRDIPLDQPEVLTGLAREILETVARRFHTTSKQPVYEIPVPHLLQIVELVARDLRETFTANIPGSHILTIHDLIRLQRLARMFPSMHRLYRLVSLIINPATGLAREFNTMMQEEMLNASAEETKRWAVQYVVRKVGFYAIELYSGNLVLRGVEFNPYMSERSKRSLAVEEKRTSALASEPLRILVIGQVKAGKSSLINSLFGEVRAAVDVVPRTKSVDPYLLERDGLQRAIILDTAGYEDPSKANAAIDQAREEVLQSDLILLVCTSLTAARDADRKLLDHLRALFQKTPDREFPPLVVALTHIDQLRPIREWSPPYNLADPQTPKARQIREAVEVTASDLAVEVDQVIPVNLAPGQIYNVDEGLVPAILNVLGAADRAKYLRCLKEFRDEQYWSQLRTQAKNTGRILLQAGMRLLTGARGGPPN